MLRGVRRSCDVGRELLHSPLIAQRRMFLEQATPIDLDAIVELLEANQLPTAGVADHLSTMIVARHGRRIAGAAGLELHSDGALLRSVVVSQAFRGQALGHRLTDAALSLAREEGVASVFLLTTTAENFFAKFGFEPIIRDDVPLSVRSSVEFTSACPTSATVMRKRLKGN